MDLYVECIDLIFHSYSCIHEEIPCLLEFILLYKNSCLQRAHTLVGDLGHADKYP